MSGNGRGKVKLVERNSSYTFNCYHIRFYFHAQAFIFPLDLIIFFIFLIILSFKNMNLKFNCRRSGSEKTAL